METWDWMVASVNMDWTEKWGSKVFPGLKVNREPLATMATWAGLEMTERMEITVYVAAIAYTNQFNR